MTREKLKIGEEVYIHGYIDEIRKDIVIIRNDGGYFGTVLNEIKTLEQEPILDKIRVEILNCLSALDEIEKSGLDIYLPNEISGRRLTYQQCLEFIDKYKAESEEIE